MKTKKTKKLTMKAAIVVMMMKITMQTRILAAVKTLARAFDAALKLKEAELE